MSRRGCSLPANASGFEPHRASISSRFGQVTQAAAQARARLEELLRAERAEAQEQRRRREEGRAEAEASLRAREEALEVQVESATVEV
eukprot:COSAG01_NODE_2361_length_7832_cov_12.919447_3_plen_88_part_00